MGIGGNGKALITAIRKDAANSFFGVGERFLLVVTLGDHFGERRNEHSETAAFLRLKHDRKAQLVRHDVAPAIIWCSSYQTQRKDQ